MDFQNLIKDSTRRYEYNSTGDIVKVYETDLYIPEELRLVLVFPHLNLIVWTYDNWSALDFDNPISLYIELERRRFERVYDGFYNGHSAQVWRNQPLLPQAEKPPIEKLRQLHQMDITSNFRCCHCGLHHSEWDVNPDCRAVKME